MFATTTALLPLASGVVVEAHGIIGTNGAVYDTWESYNGHSTYRHTEDGVRIGRVGSRELPAELNALPRGNERYERVMAWMDATYQESYAAILAAFPEASEGHRSMGSIVK